MNAGPPDQGDDLAHYMRAAAANKARAEKAEGLLREVALSGVAFADPRVKYVEIQVDRSTWEDIQAWRHAT